MEFNGKRIAMIATTDDMIERFMPPHIEYLVENGASVDIYCKFTGFDCVNTKKIPNVKMVDISFTRFPFTLKNLKGYSKLKKCFKVNKYDLVSCMQPVGGVMGRLVAHKFKVPCLYTAHGFHFYNGSSFTSKLLYKNIEKFCAKYTDILVTMNEEDYNASKLMKAKHCYKINGIGVDLTKYKRQDDFDKIAFKKELGIPENSFVVTSVGELNKNKNTYRLLEMMKSIDGNIYYLVCGTGKLIEEYKKYVLDNDLEDKVKILGFRKDVDKILNITDVYIMPSYREGLSKSMMEAMCYGLPVVASNIRGNRDLIGENEGGILCEVENNEQYKQVILDIYSSEELRNKFRDRNLEYIKNYDINVVLKQMAEIYKNL